jgi:fucose permease
MKKTLAALLAAYVLLGMATTMLGPLLPLLQAQWQLSDRQLGLLFVAQFCGGFAGSMLSGEVTRRRSAAFTGRLGFLLIAAGFAIMPWPQPGTLILGIASYGIGIGLALPSITLTVCALFRDQPARALNLLNFFWAVGAIAAPGLVLKLVAGDLHRLRTTLLAAAVLQLPFVLRLPATAEQPAALGRAGVADGLAGRELRLILSCALLIFAYVGVENGVAGWMPTFAMRFHGLEAGKIAALQAIFWAAFLLSRLLTAALIRSGDELRLLAPALLTAALGSLILLGGRGEASQVVAALLMGAGFAPVFPTAVSLLTASISDEWRPRLGWVYAAGGLGGAAVPYAIGALSNATGNLRSAMSLLLLAEFVVFLMLLLMKRQSQSRALSRF